MGNRTASIYSDFEFRFEEDLIWLDLGLFESRYGQI